MIQNYFKVALRGLLKNKVYSCINIFGLGIGIACCILISFFLKHELSFDKFHDDPKFIYRVLPDLPNIKVASLPFLLIPSLANSYAEIEQAVRLYTDSGLIKTEEGTFEEKLSYTDPGFFKMFNFPLIEGDPQQVLADRFSTVLNEKTANKYFGDESPIGKSITIMHSTYIQSYIVRGVAAPIPAESTIQFSILLPFENLKYGRHAASYKNWQQFLVTGFIRIENNIRINALAEKLPSFLFKNMNIEISSNHFDPPLKGLKFQPFSEYHLGDEDGGPGLEPVSNRQYLYILTSIAALILLMACFNFINLTIGSSSGRFKEVGMRKVLGAQRSQLIKQFWLESVLMSCIAFIIGLALADLFLPSFKTLLNTDLPKDNISFFILGGVILFIGVLAGSYPALLISGFKTIDIFKGQLKIGGTNPISRLMIILQFVISICLIFSVIMFSKQLRFIQRHNLGFDPKNVIVIPTQEATKLEGAKLFLHYKNELVSNPNIINISAASGSFQRWFAVFSFFTMEDGTVMDVARYGVDANFIQTMELELIEGRNFRASESDIGNTMIVNETFMHTFSGIAKLNTDFPYRIYTSKRKQIIGVVKDFHFESFKKTIMPTALVLDLKGEIKYGKIDCILIRIKPDNTTETIATLKRIWQRYRPYHAFSYNFMEEDIRQQYQTEDRWRHIISFASAFAIIIVSLGILGLASLSATRRQKEIGIRKVLGASASQVLHVLNREFILLFVVANIVAWPISYKVVSNFLENFAYRTSLNLSDFLIGSFIVLIFAGTVTCLKTLKVTMENPVKIIKYE